jgi:hypothetical protein
VCKPTCVWDSQHSCTQCFNLGADPEYCKGRLGVWEITKCKCANNYVRARAATDQGRQAIRFCCAQKPQRQFRHMQVRSFAAMRTKARSPMGGSWYSRVATHAQKQFVKTQRTPPWIPHCCAGRQINSKFPPPLSISYDKCTLSRNILQLGRAF